MATKLIYFLYRSLGIVTLPLIVLYVLYRGVRDRRYFRRVGERLGFLPPAFRQKGGGAVWLHAVSVGEVLSAVELVRRMRACLPGVPVFVSTTTLAGRATAEEKLGALADGIFYLPFDYVSCVRRAIRIIRPNVLVVMETEIWPNLYREMKRSGAGVMIVNGRISDRAEPRYSALRPFFKHVLAHCDLVLAQSARDRDRFAAAGAPAQRVRAGGNLKYDFEPKRNAAPEAVCALLERLPQAEVWISASTMPPAESGDIDEDDAVLAAFDELAARRPNLLLVLVPRKPERFDVVAAKLAPRSFVRRTQLTGASALALPGILLVDTIGELGSLFPFAKVVFMGGTLALRGGHNVLEPALCGRAVIAGPHMENFAAIADEFTAGGGLVRIGGPGELGSCVDALLNDDARRNLVASRALALAEDKRGATARAITEIAALHGRALPRRLHPLPSKLLLWPLARIWDSAGARRQSIQRGRRERLNAAVISVGGISMGGSGKTPFALWLAERLSRRGASPAFLTRGYRRKTPEAVTLIPAGGPASTHLTGDEAQLLVRSGLGPVGIGANRCQAGAALVEKFHPTAILLDDGFQHEKLARDANIVLIDSLDPFAGDDTFPLGRLRESPRGLWRADAIVLTRTAGGRSYEGIEKRLRQFNRNAPIFHAAVQPLFWTDGHERWQPTPLPFARMVAFCGLANPRAFWNTLDALGIPTAMRFSFGDHHNYKPTELMRLAGHARQLKADVLLTTEKDAMNLPPDAGQLLNAMRICWLRIGMSVDREEELLELVEKLSSASNARL